MKFVFACFLSLALASPSWAVLDANLTSVSNSTDWQLGEYASTYVNKNGGNNCTVGDTEGPTYLPSSGARGTADGSQILDNGPSVHVCGTMIAAGRPKAVLTNNVSGNYCTLESWGTYTMSVDLTGATSGSNAAGSAQAAVGADSWRTVKSTDGNLWTCSIQFNTETVTNRVNCPDNELKYTGAIKAAVSYVDNGTTKYLGYMVATWDRTKVGPNGVLGAWLVDWRRPGTNDTGSSLNQTLYGWEGKETKLVGAWYPNMVYWDIPVGTEIKVHTAIQESTNYSNGSNSGWKYAGQLIDNAYSGGTGQNFKRSITTPVAVTVTLRPFK